MTATPLYVLGAGPPAEPADSTEILAAGLDTFRRTALES